MTFLNFSKVEFPSAKLHALAAIQSKTYPFVKYLIKMRIFWNFFCFFFSKKIVIRIISVIKVFRNNGFCCEINLFTNQFKKTSFVTNSSKLL